MNYQDAYYYLFNQITDLQQALKVVQLQAEEICIASDETEPPPAKAGGFDWRLKPPEDQLTATLEKL